MLTHLLTQFAIPGAAHLTLPGMKFYSQIRPNQFFGRYRIEFPRSFPKQSELTRSCLDGSNSCLRFLCVFQTVEFKQILRARPPAILELCIFKWQPADRINSERRLLTPFLRGKFSFADQSLNISTDKNLKANIFKEWMARKMDLHASSTVVKIVNKISKKSFMNSLDTLFYVWDIKDFKWTSLW